ncbi:DsbA family oxidoreductase [Oryzibacter oryziterrae]|uniref:DsbA family oxidoreductase n=1 Tax=Oryzibacter oryziterrae TaxID=2766474 RepID=UPI001F351643|nr:DsbA family oxidoreductase [Oryzibacter oryziterrae]
MNKPRLHLDVIVDVVCPWCFLGKRRLDAAMEELPDIDFSIAYRPYQLDPNLPKAGAERQAYMRGKFPDRNALDEAHARLTDMGRDVGIAYAFDAIPTVPNTLDAHRLIRWAQEAQLGDEMVEHLFKLYFEDAADLTQQDVLIAAAETVGLDEDEVTMKLDDGADVEIVKADIAHASALGISGVPCIIVDRKFAISGAQSSDILVQAFGKIAAELQAAAR